MAIDPLKALEATAEVLPEVYGDVAKPAATQTGLLLARVPAMINAALSSIDIWIAKREYAVEETKKLLAIKLQNVNPDDIVPPEPYVAVPAIQAISYCMDSSELREMYANLLAKSMTAYEKDKVHPGFVEIIKQMSPLDAENLTYIDKTQPIVKMRYDLFPRGNMIIATNVFLSNPKRNDIKRQAISLSSLQHLGLINLVYDRHLVRPDAYDAFEALDIYKTLKETIPPPEIIQAYKSPSDDDEVNGVSLLKGLCELTPLGTLFKEVCIDTTIE